MVVLTIEEITQFRSQLAEYPEALTTLDVIQECEGHLEDAATLLMMRQMGKELDRGVNDILKKCRTVICQEEFRNDLAGGLLGIAVEPVAISVGIPPSVATVFVLYAYKVGIKKFCEPLQSDS